MQYQVENGEVVNKVIYPQDIATGKFVYPFKWESA
jgi:hypothetical protein